MRLDHRESRGKRKISSLTQLFTTFKKNLIETYLGEDSPLLLIKAKIR